jgi:hypothetical protein
MSKINKKEDDKLDNQLKISKSKNFYWKDEVYCNWYVCVDCDNTYLRINDNFCSNCGSKLEWVE